MYILGVISLWQLGFCKYALRGGCSMVQYGLKCDMISTVPGTSFPGRFSPFGMVVLFDAVEVCS